MEEPPLEEANHAARATDARNEPTMSTPSLKSFRDGVPRAASYSDSRNVYHDNTLRDEANRAANSSVREVSRQHTLQNEATPAAWRSDAHRFVRIAHVQGIAVRFRIHRNAGDSQFLARADDSQGDFPAVGN